MNEDDLRSDYWVDTRSHQAFPLWVIFRQVGHDPARHDGHPYVRHSDLDIPTVLKRLEQLDGLPLWAEQIGVHAEELRAVLWYLIWKAETTMPPNEWADWNRRVDEAWAHGVLTPADTR